MAILIAQARFAVDDPQGVAPAPADRLEADRLEAANRLVANFGGTLIASYRISGDHDVLLIFEAASYEEALQALGAAGSGLADLKIGARAGAQRDQAGRCRVPDGRDELPLRRREHRTSRRGRTGGAHRRARRRGDDG